LDYKPLTLKFNQGINETQRIPQSTNEAANRIKGNPGTGSGTTRELEEPFQKEVTISPEIEVWEIGIRHTRTIETGEQEGSCPSTPPSIEAWSWLGFSVDNSEPWDPYNAGLFRWEEYSRTGEYEYGAPVSLGGVPTLGAYKPSDPRLVHRFYEEDPREPESNLKKYDAPLLMRFGTPISQLVYIGFAFLITMGVADAVTMWLGGTSLGLAGAAKSIAGVAGGLKLLSPFGISRYPLFGKGMADRAMKALENRIWRDAYQKLKIWENDPSKIPSLIKFREADRAYKRAYLKKWIIGKVFPRGGWWIYNKIRRGEPQRKLDRLEQERFDALSRLLPDEAVMLRQLNSWRSKKWVTGDEAGALWAKIKEQADKQLTGGWRILYPFWPLALLSHRENWAVVAASVFGIGGKVPRGFIERGFDVPMAYKRIGIGRVKAGDKTIPVPMEKASIVGPGFVYRQEHQKFVLDSGEAKPVERKDGTYEIMEAYITIKNPRICNDPEIKVWRPAANETIEIDGKAVEWVNLNPQIPPDKISEVEAAFKQFAKEATHGQGEDWAWRGGFAEDTRVYKENAVRSRDDWEVIEKELDGLKKKLAEARSNSSRDEGLSDKVDLKGGIEKAKEETEEGSREASSRTRTKDLWGDGE
jgi:hypothetical protein